MTRRNSDASARTLALAAALALAASGGARADTLAEAFASAYETNPELLSARASLSAVDERVNQARAGYRPEVSASVRYGADYNNLRIRGSDDAQDPFTASIDAAQTLYDGGQTSNSVRGRIADVSATRAQINALEQDVLLRTVTAYVDVLRDEEFVRLARNNVRVITEQLRASRDRFEVGEVTRTDVSQAEAALAEANANLADVIGNLERSRQDYRQVVGAEPINLMPQPPLPPLPQTVDEAVTIALANHPDVIAARFTEESRVRDVRTQIGGLLPQVALEASVGYGDSAIFANSATSDQTDASIGVRATIPLYQGGAQYSRIREAQARASQARADISVQARARRQLVEAAWSELAVARASIVAGRERVRAAQLAFEGVREEAIVGSRTTLDVLDAEQETLDARTSLVDAQRNEYVAGYTLVAAVGALTAAEQGLTVVAYDPDVRYDLNNDRLFGYEQTEDTVWEEIWRP